MNMEKVVVRLVFGSLLFSAWAGIGIAEIVTGVENDMLCWTRLSFAFFGLLFFVLAVRDEQG